MPVFKFHLFEIDELVLLKRLRSQNELVSFMDQSIAFGDGSLVISLKSSDYDIVRKMQVFNIFAGPVIVFGDLEGVIIVPREAEEEAFAGAIEKARGEKQVKQALEQGMSTVEAFAKFGIM